jgi:PAS domain S-box-containing protein
MPAWAIAATRSRQVAGGQSSRRGPSSLVMTSGQKDDRSGPGAPGPQPSERPTPRTLLSLVALAMIPEQSPDLVLRVTDTGHLLYFNASAEAALQGALQLGSKAPPEFLPAVAQAIASKSVQRVELKRGERWYWVTTKADGEKANVYARDITHRKLAEERLRESEQRYRKLVEMFPDAVIVHQCRRIVFANPAALRLLGASGPEALLGRDVVDHVHPEEQTAIRARIEEAEAGASAEWCDVRVRRLDGADVLCEAAGVGIEHQGRPAAQLVIRDITARKQAQQGLREANERLREADRAKNEFLAVLSHELRNPLAPIKNSLYILGRAAAGGEQARRAQAIVARQVDQLSRLVDDLLDVTRIARNKLALQRSRLELGQLVRRTLEDYRPIFEKAGVYLELEMDPSPVHVHADSQRMAQVVGNLLNNAAKFTPRGGRVIVRVTAEPAAARAVVTVADTGLGLTPELKAFVFEPFMQAAEGLEHREGGLGLGLALVKGVVELHGGDVSASSAGPGQGSRFVVRLPLDLGEPAPAKPRAAPSADRPRRVLVIEDNVDAADSLRDVLQLQGHEVAVAYDGPSGIATAREFHPEVVLCDIGLPGMDGYEVARTFRADEALRGAQLVALSGYALADDLQRASEAGFEQHLTKPANFEKLAAVLTGA